MSTTDQQTVEAFCTFYYIHFFYNLQRKMGKKWVKNVFMIHKTINLYDKYKFQASLTYKDYIKSTFKVLV